MKKNILYIIIFLISCDKNDYNDYEHSNINCDNPINTSQDYMGTCCPTEELDCNNLCYGFDFTSCRPCNDPEAINYVEGSLDNNNCIYESIGEQWELSWNDEFNTETLDNYKWVHQLGTGSQYGLAGWGNDEVQYYTDETINLNINPCDNNKSCLFINAYKQDYLGSEYTSSRIRSVQSQAYGKIEIRAKLPIANGTWPAFWMLPQSPSSDWPASGEIDIMEHVGCSAGSVHGSIHCTDYNHQDGTEQTGVLSSIDVNQFHIYSIDWDEDSIKWYIDDNQYFEYNKESDASIDSWPFDDNFYLILNLAIGGDWGTLGGSCPIDYNSFPQTIEIDYVRIFNKID